MRAILIALLCLTGIANADYNLGGYAPPVEQQSYEAPLTKVQAKSPWQTFREAAVSRDGTTVVVAIGQNAPTIATWSEICANNGWKFYAAAEWPGRGVGVHHFVSRGGELRPIQAVAASAPSQSTTSAIQYAAQAPQISYSLPAPTYAAAPVYHASPDVFYSQRSVFPSYPSFAPSVSRCGPLGCF